MSTTPRSPGTTPLPYGHSQNGTVMLVTVAIILAVVAVTVLLLAGGPGGEGLVALAAPVALCAALLALFGRLTVSVDQQFVRVAFGIGLIARQIPLSTIRSCEPVRNRWWYGWGIRMTPRGWLWNVSGLSAVELTYTDGGHFLIGTDDPDGLCAAIRAARA